MNGECYGDWQCDCPDVYQGTLCETCLCVNGQCNVTVCECDPGWKGIRFMILLNDTIRFTILQRSVINCVFLNLVLKIDSLMSSTVIS